jgi:hypothetical protein
VLKYVAAQAISKEEALRKGKAEVYVLKLIKNDL